MINPHDIRNAKILVVDDCADNVDLLVEILHMEGYSCVSSSMDSSQVCTLHAKNGYDLILLDMHMPGLNGLEVMEGLKQIEKDAYLPVLAITGDRSYKIAALEAGARDFISKPYDLLEFKMRIRNMLEVRLLYKTVAEQSRLQKEMALHDPLTGLPNRRLLADRIEKAMQHVGRNHQMMAVMYIDIDGFKEVNDRHGHQCGDELLRQVADRLRAATRQEDTVARIGGDEFIILLPDVACVEDVAHPASKVLRSMATAFDIDGLPVRVTASIGVAFYPDDAEYAESLIARADNALYEAKRLGKNQYYFTDGHTLSAATM
jgi:two-component system, cell cycle response regulator